MTTNALDEKWSEWDQRKDGNRVPSCQYLSARLNYDPDTGVITWKSRPISDFSSSCTHKCINKRHAGKVAGYAAKGKQYGKIGINGVWYPRHTIAWSLYYGGPPDGVIDHINGDINDNRICNLRDCSRSDNCRNSKKYKSNKSGLTGVVWHKASNKWCAQITLDGKRTYLGVFDDKHEAYEKYLSVRSGHGFSHRHGL